MKMEDLVENEEVEELKDNQYDLPEIEKSKVTKTQSSMSTSSLDSGIGLTLKSQYSTVSSLISDLDTTGCKIADVSWNVDRADLVIKVEQTLFPVHRSLISFYSDVLKTIIFSVNFGDEDTQMVTLMEQRVQSMNNLLTYIYFQEKEVSDDVVLDLLAMADEFVVEKLVGRCEGFLLSRSERSPIELLKIGKKYQLRNLVELAMVRVSRLPTFLEQVDDADLGLEIENRIFRLVIHHYKSSKIQCSLHNFGDEDCCYENTKFNAVGDSDDDSSDDEDSVCYPDYLKYKNSILYREECGTSDSDD